ncbi:MAG: restriction endonuclease subunit S [Dysgonamonadaceae bacterium]|nr:restriction endonuclease subunit S [Dysgonamonadaceae bacterium]
MDLEDIEKDTAKLLQRVKKCDRKTTSTRHSFVEGNVLYSKLRTYLNKVLVADEDGFCTTEILPLDFKGYVVPEYARRVLMSQMFLDYTEQCGYGVKMPRLGTTDGQKAPFPLPPLAEQRRIVSVIESAFALIDVIEDSKTSLQQIIKQAKAKTLDLAIKGKLVSVSPAPTTADNSPYQDLKEGWKQYKLEDVLEYEQPQKYIVASTDYSDDYETPVLTAGKSFIIGYTDEKDGIFSKLPVIIFDDFTTDSKYVDFPFKVKSSAMKILTANKEIADTKYLYYLMQTIEVFNDTHKRYWISDYSKNEVKLPPLPEQQLIVAQIETIFSQLDDIEKEVK